VHCGLRTLTDDTLPRVRLTCDMYEMSTDQVLGVGGPEFDIAGRKLVLLNQ